MLGQNEGALTAINDRPDKGVSVNVLAVTIAHFDALTSRWGSCRRVYALAASSGDMGAA